MATLPQTKLRVLCASLRPGRPVTSADLVVTGVSKYLAVHYVRSMSCFPHGFRTLRSPLPSVRWKLLNLERLQSEHPATSAAQQAQLEERFAAVAPPSE